MDALYDRKFGLTVGTSGMEEYYHGYLAGQISGTHDRTVVQDHAEFRKSVSRSQFGAFRYFVSDAGGYRQHQYRQYEDCLFHECKIR